MLHRSFSGDAHDRTPQKFCETPQILLFHHICLLQKMFWHEETSINPWLRMNLNQYLHYSHIGSLLWLFLKHKTKRRSTFDPHFTSPPPPEPPPFSLLLCSSSSWWTCSPQTRRQPQSVSVLRPSPARPGGGFLPGRAGNKAYSVTASAGERKTDCY